MSIGLAIVGYGRMGRLIERLAPEYGFDVRAKFTRENNLHDAGINRDSLGGYKVSISDEMPAPWRLRKGKYKKTLFPSFNLR